MLITDVPHTNHVYEMDEMASIAVITQTVHFQQKHDSVSLISLSDRMLVCYHFTHFGEIPTTPLFRRRRNSPIRQYKGGMYQF